MTYLLALLTVAGTVLIACVGLYFTRRIIKAETLRQRHDVTAAFLTLSGSVYAILIGMIIVDSMNDQARAKNTIDLETANLADIYIFAGNLPQQDRVQVRKAASSYVNQVLDTEWARMSCGHMCSFANKLGIELINDVLTVKPKTELEKNIYPLIVSEAQNFWQNRQARLTQAERNIPPLELFALLVGAVFLIGWTYFLDANHFYMQLFMTAMTATLLALNFVLLFLFTYPFRGDFALQTEPFHKLQEIFQEVDITVPNLPAK